MNWIRNELQKIHDERLAMLSANGLLEIEERYWRKRAEIASYSIVEMVDASATDIAKGQISICHETADEALRTRKAKDAKANPFAANTISGNGASTV